MPGRPPRIPVDVRDVGQVGEGLGDLLIRRLGRGIISKVACRRQLDAGRKVELTVHVLAEAVVALAVDRVAERAVDGEALRAGQRGEVAAVDLAEWQRRLAVTAR